jgi:hypothetical protein
MHVYECVVMALVVLPSTVREHSLESAVPLRSAAAAASAVTSLYKSRRILYKSCSTSLQAATGGSMPKQQPTVVEHPKEVYLDEKWDKLLDLS